jgi:hypothetical protein
MDFLLFQLLFAAVMLALLVILALAVRSTLRTRRQRSGPRLARTSTRSKPKLFSGDEAPEPAAPVKTARRRQIGPAAKIPGEEMGNPVFPQAAEDSGDDRNSIAPAEPATSPPPSTATFHDLVMASLEDAFDRYNGGVITLAEYVTLVRLQQTQVDARIDALRQEAESEHSVDDTLRVRDAIDWCLEWADGIAYDEPA